MSIEAKELPRGKLQELRIAHEGNADFGLLIGHIEALEQEEHFSHKLISRQGKLLTGVVNAIRGNPPRLLMHSVHDTPDLARLAMEVVHAARAALEIADRDTDVFNRLRAALDAMPRPEIECAQCGGGGEVKEMVSLGGHHPQETTAPCSECCGHGFVTSTETLADPGVALPDWEAISRKAESGQPLSPIEAFIMRLEPGDVLRGEDFRRMLRAALDYTADQVKR